MIRRLAAFVALLAMGSVDAQAATRSYPSLAKRPAESRDRDASPEVAVIRPAETDTALANTVSDLKSKADMADTAFRAELTRTQGNVSAATGAEPVSESWVVAQMSISAADSARYESVAALASLDTLHVDRMAGADNARIAADLAIIDPARSQVLAMVDNQNDALDALKSALTMP